MHNYIKELENFERLVKQLDDQLTILLSQITQNVIENNKDVTQFEFLRRIMMASSLVQAIGVDLSQTFIDLGILATQEQGTDFTKKIINEIRMMHGGDKPCNCGVCSFLVNKVEELNKTQVEKIDPSKLN